MLEEFRHVCDGSVDSNLVLPLELGPHVAEGHVCAACGGDVVHDVDVDVVEDHNVTVELPGCVVDDVAENDASLGGGDLQGGEETDRFGGSGVLLGPRRGVLDCSQGGTGIWRKGFRSGFGCNPHSGAPDALKKTLLQWTSLSLSLFL